MDLINNDRNYFSDQSRFDIFLWLWSIGRDNIQQQQKDRLKSIEEKKNDPMSSPLLVKYADFHTAVSPKDTNQLYELGMTLSKMESVSSWFLAEQVSFFPLQIELTIHLFYFRCFFALWKGTQIMKYASMPILNSLSKLIHR